MTKSISPLRRRMIDDMTIRNMSPSTQKIYTYAVANFSAFHRRAPDKLTFEDVRVYRLHLISRGLKPNSINPIMGALRFFYGTILGLKEVAEHMPYARRARDPRAVLHRRLDLIGKGGPAARPAACAPAIMDAMLGNDEGVGSGRSNTWRALWRALMAGVTAAPQAVQAGG
jgi:hypothetical protein